MDLAVDPQPHEALRAQLLEQVRLLALASDDERREDHQARVFRQLQHVIHHLRHALRGEQDVVIGAVRVADAREQQAQVVVDLGDGADRGAGVMAPRLLLDRDGGGKPLDQVHVRLLHQLQELPRVGRERLDVAALSLRVERVECERGLAGARQPRDHDQPVARQVEVDVLEVVGARAAHADVIGRAGGVGPRGLQPYDGRARSGQGDARANVNLLIYRRLSRFPNLFHPGEQ